MWLILLFSVIAFAVFAERAAYFYRASIRLGEFLSGLANLIQRRNFAEALHECAGTPGPVARVIHAAIIRHEAPRNELKEIVQEAGQLEMTNLERNLGLLATIALIAPLVGLLGTVTGLIETFVTISSHGGVASTTDLSGGIYQSLLTTAAGLVVAIPAFAAYSYLSSRVNAFMRDMERGGIEVVSLITACRDSEDGAQIIDFKATRGARAAE